MIRFNVTNNSIIARWPVRGATVLLLGASTIVSACSFVPDWGNPVVWYDSIIGDIEGSDDAPPKADSGAIEQAQIKSDNKSLANFPQLKSVPQQAPQASSSKELRQIAQSLIADRDNARYTDKVLQAGGVPKPVARLASTPTSAKVPQTSQMIGSVQTAKPDPTPAPQPAVALKLVQPPSEPVLRTAKARLPKLDLSSAPRTEVETVSPPPQSSVPQTDAVSNMTRSIVEPLRDKNSVVPYPPLKGIKPSRVTSGGVSSITQADLSEAPAPIPNALQSVPTSIGMAPGKSIAPHPKTQMAILSSVGAEQGTLAQAFADALAQSAATVTTAPANTAFGLPTATPLSPSETSAPDIVRETYNQTLIVGSGVTPLTAVSSNGTDSVMPSGQATVLFLNGSSALNGKAKAIIRDIVEMYKTRQGSFRIVGHASHRTKNLPVQRHKLVNFRISLDRATVVANELIRLGVHKSAIQIAAVSDSQPIFYESMPEGEAGNRRAEIFYTF